MFKCSNCHTFFSSDTGKCPDCGKLAEKMCVKDHMCTCMHDVQPGVHYCDVCGKPTCECGSHDVTIVSRVTGYLSDVGGWNAAKRQELKDRQRVTV